MRTSRSLAWRSTSPDVAHLGRAVAIVAVFIVVGSIEFANRVRLNAVRAWASARHPPDVGTALLLGVLISGLVALDQAKL